MGASTEIVDYDQLFPGRFLKAGEFNGKPVTLTIARIRIEDLPSDKGGEVTKGIVGFAETKKEWVLNKTNGECLKAMWTRDVTKWKGKKVTLYPAPFNGDIAIRVMGSPDLAQDLEFELKLPRKSAKKVVLRATGKKPAAGAKPQKPQPQPDPVTGEIVEERGEPGIEG